MSALAVPSGALARPFVETISCVETDMGFLEQVIGATDAHERDDIAGAICSARAAPVRVAA